MTSLTPARLFGLAPRKGTLRPGADADLVLADLGARRPVWTMVRGAVVVDKGEVVGAPGWGRYLPR